MPTLVATGQLTIVDVNDGVPGPALTLTTTAQGFTFLDGVATPAQQYIGFQVVRHATTDPVQWFASNGLELVTDASLLPMGDYLAGLYGAGDGDVAYMTVEQLGSDSQVVITAMAGGLTATTTAVRLEKSTAAAGATVGATWGVDVGSIPTNIATAGASPTVGVLNNAITISPTGALSGAGGGQVTTIPVFDRDRAIDRPPNWYPVGTTREFKAAATFPGVTGGTYMTLETIIQYQDGSGGAAYQYAYCGTSTWRRTGICAAASWAGAWVQDLDRTVYTGALNATANQSDAVTNAAISDAQAAAISAAATAAQAKADLAKAEAQAYADGVVDAAELVLIADATTKANAAQAAAVAAAALDATAKANAASAKANSTDGAITLIARPVGGSFSGGVGLTGAIKIRLPVLWTDTMMQFSVEVYNYATNTSFTALIGGYNYTGASWYNTSASIVGGASANLTVRFGHDGVKACVWIGEVGTTWQYPKIAVKNLQLGQANTGIATWEAGWAVSFVTAFDTVQITDTDNLVQASDVLKVGGTLAATVRDNASTALTNANAANTLLADIASDAKLVPSEKHAVRKEWDAVISEKAGIEAQATALAITTQKTAYTSAVQALGTYLNAGVAYTLSTTVPPSWINDASLATATVIVGATFRSAWLVMYDARQGLLNKIAEVASTKASWGGVEGVPANVAALTGTEGILNSNVFPLLTNAGGSLVPDYALSSVSMWRSHVPGSYEFSGANFVTVADGKVGPTAFRKSTTIPCWNYSETAVPLVAGRIYTSEFWCRRSAGATGSWFMTYQCVKADGTVNTADSTGYVYQGLTPPPSAGGAWELKAASQSAAWVSARIAAGTVAVRPGFALEHSGATAATWGELQGFRFFDATAEITANTAVTNAATAQTAANTANTALANIASDSILSPSEKPSVVQDYTVIMGEQAGIDAQATAYGITTEKAGYDAAVSALTTYLGTLTGWNTVPGVDVTIVGTAFRQCFSNVYTSRQSLLTKIAAVAGTTANWATVSGTGKPSDNATANIFTSGTLAARPTGANGDTYFATDTSVLYQKIAGAWTSAATVGAPAGTNVGSTPAQTVESNAATALEAIQNAATGLATRMRANADNVLGGVLVADATAAPVGLRVGTVTWDATGAVTGGVGVAITPKGIFARNAAKTSFVLDATTGDATFSGNLTGANITGATGTFSGMLTAETLGSMAQAPITVTASGNVTVPVGMTSVRYELVGGGGGGGGGATGYAAGYGGGGGAGGYMSGTLTVTPGAVLAVVIGAAGTGGATATSGTAGTASTLAGTVSAAGGAAGGGTAGGFGAGGAAGTSVPALTSTAGATAARVYDGLNLGLNGYGQLNGEALLNGAGWPKLGVTGAGGSTPKGAGGTSVNTGVGSAGVGYGSGGGGGGGSLSTSVAAGGGAGRPGVAVLTFLNPNGVVLQSQFESLKAALTLQGITVT